MFSATAMQRIHLRKFSVAGLCCSRVAGPDYDTGGQTGWRAEDSDGEVVPKEGGYVRREVQRDHY